jgi:uncharacterized membrane protein YbhN (UPF0104 family)
MRPTRPSGAPPAGDAATPALVEAPAPDREPDDEPHGTRLEITRRNVVAIVAFLALCLVALYVLLPQVAGLEETWGLIEDGNPYWIALGLVFTIGSIGGYIALFRGVFLRKQSTVAMIDWRESYQITMAGLAATRLFAAGGAGGIVLTAWALRQNGMPRRQVADKSVAFLFLTYVVFVLALVVCGLGLRWGVFPGEAPWGFTTLPALLGLLALSVGFGIASIPTDLERRLGSLSCRGGRVGRWATRLAHVPAAASAGVREALLHLRSGDLSLVGALAFWAFQIAVLWAGFHAFGDPPPTAVLVMGFFLGMLGNLLPMPGGVGGVEGAMVAAFAAFGVNTGLAFVAVLVYRAFVFWLPTVPGAIAYFQLRKTVERWRQERRRGAQRTATV